MHLRARIKVIFVLLLIGFLPENVSGQEVSPDVVHTDPKTDRNYDEQGHPLLFVEPTNGTKVDTDGKPMILNYRQRRTNWGQLFSIGASTFVPQNFSPNFVDADYSTVYSQKTPLIEANFLLKKNMSIGSIGLEFGGGYLKNNSNPTATIDNNPTVLTSALEVVILRLGATLTFDMIFENPYVAPYISAGAYEIIYRESEPSTAVSGTTTLAPYFTLGLNFGLGWLDPESAQASFKKIGLQEMYIYLDVRSLIASSSSSDPEFDSQPFFDAGLRFEF
jgi:hypothetical protein